jgi:hypothetical protein
MNSTTFIPKHIIIQSEKDKENLESTKREAIYCIQRIPKEITSRSLIRNFGVWKQWVNIFSVLRKKLSTMNPTSNKTLLQK